MTALAPDDIPPVFHELVGFLRHKGLVLVRNVLDERAFGNRIILFSDAMIAVEFVKDRSHWDILVSDAAFRPKDWYDIPLLSMVCGDSIADCHSIAFSLKRQAAMLQNHWGAIIELFSFLQRGITHGRLAQLRRDRAEKIFQKTIDVESIPARSIGKDELIDALDVFLLPLPEEIQEVEFACLFDAATCVTWLKIIWPDQISSSSLLWINDPSTYEPDVMWLGPLVDWRNWPLINTESGVFGTRWLNPQHDDRISFWISPSRKKSGIQFFRFCGVDRLPVPAHKLIVDAAEPVSRHSRDSMQVCRLRWARKQ